MSASQGGAPRGAVRALMVVGTLAAALVLATVAYNALVSFVDEALNGAFIDWVSSQFLDAHNLAEFGVSAEVALDTAGTRYFFFQLGAIVVVLLVGVAAGAAAVASRRRAREERARAASLVRAYMTRDLDASEAFPEGWEELALEASRVKREAQDQARRLAEEAARKNDLVTYLAHDLRTPLTSVIGYLTLLSEVPEMPAEQRARYTGVALDKALRLERLVNEFFDITRYNLTHIELELAPVDLAYLLCQVADEFYPALSSHGNVAEVTVGGSRRTAEEPGEPLMVVADAARLARVLNNLIKNAIAYSSEGTPVEVSARVEGDEAVIAVSDEGVTIPSHKLRAIFDKFYRVDESRASDTGGAGLGLAIAREIVELHGGTIAAESEAGRTTFTVRLPRGGAA